MLPLNSKYFIFLHTEPCIDYKYNFGILLPQMFTMKLLCDEVSHILKKNEGLYIWKNFIATKLCIKSVNVCAFF